MKFIGKWSTLNTGKTLKDKNTNNKLYKLIVIVNPTSQLHHTNQPFDYAQDDTTSPYRSKSAASVIFTVVNSPVFK